MKISAMEFLLREIREREGDLEVRVADVDKYGDPMTRPVEKLTTPQVNEESDRETDAADAPKVALIHPLYSL